MTEDGYDPFTKHPAAAVEALLGDGCPIRTFGGFDHPLHIVHRHADVRSILSQQKLYTMKFGQLHLYEPGQGLTVDPPVHTTLRRLLNPLFTAQSVGRHADAIAAIADRLIDAIIDRGAADIYPDFAATYAVNVAADMFGIDPSRQQQFRGWATDFSQGIQSGDEARANAGRDGVYRYFGTLMDDRRARIARGEPVPEDLVTVLVRGVHPEGRPFVDDELLPTTILLLVGGIETTSFLITNCLYRLLSERSLWERVRADPALVPVAVEESLRFDAPVLGLFRTNEEPVCLHGRELPADSKIQLVYAAANRDATVFAEADRFSLDRDLITLRRDHFAFGGGIHACLGSALARLSARTALASFIRRMPDLALAGPAARFETQPGGIAINNGFISLPVTWAASGGDA